MNWYKKAKKKEKKKKKKKDEEMKEPFARSMTYAESSKWYKAGKRFTDEEIWLHHGVDAKACREEFKEAHAKRDAMRRKAEKQSSALGHKLGPWGIMNISRCRKCGMNCCLPNINGQTDAPDIIDGYGDAMVGGAATQKCPSNLVVPKDYWKKSDRHYKDTYKDQDSAVIG